MDYGYLKSLLFNVMLMISFLYITLRIKPFVEESKRKAVNMLLSSISTGLLSILCMIFPIYQNTNFIFDFRSNPILLLGMCKGFIPSMLAAIIAGMYRIYLGGTSAYYGVLYGTIIPALMGSIYYWLLKNKRKKVSISRSLNGWGLISMAGLLGIKDYLVFKYIIPGGNELIDKIGVSMPLAYFLIFMIMGAIIRDNYKLSQRQSNLKEEAVTDELTKLKNYRYIVNRVYNLIEEDGNKYKHIAFMMVDIDKFKTYNDTFGHLEGNKALKSVSEILLESIREGDIVTRYGGEEFLIILKGVSTKGAYKIAERIRKNVSNLGPSLSESGRRRNITISIGISGYPVHGVDVHDLINKADKALYRAKELGRNNVQIYSIAKEDDHYDTAIAVDKM